MAPWYDEIPPWTSPPVVASVPPRPAFDVASRPQEVLEPVVTMAEANLSEPLERSSHAEVQPSWRLEVACSAYTDLNSWLDVMLELVKYPERTSTNILRADVLLEAEEHQDHLEAGWSPIKSIVREILPRRPGVNPTMLELCRFYRSSDDGQSALVTYTPLMVADCVDARAMNSVDELLAASRRPDTPAEIPFYHPAVLSLAFTFRARAGQNPHELPKGKLEIHMLPFPSNANDATLQRVANSLLKTIHIHAWGKAHSYKARIAHDRLVSRHLFQDVYLNLKLRWASFLCKEWKEKTNPEKHVHEDLAVCAWLMLFWRSKFGRPTFGDDEKIGLRDRPWLSDTRAWGRPRGGFVDVGCGNGLLVWLLNNEGYTGHGFDLRPRKSWELFEYDSVIEVEYPAPKIAGKHLPARIEVSMRKADLRVHTLDAMNAIHAYLQDPTSSSDEHSELLPRGSFLVGNHADELTPLLPFLASTIQESSGLLNIPCCPWMVSGDRFTRTNYRISREEVASLLAMPLDETATPEQIEALRAEMVELALGPPVDAPQTSTQGENATASKNEGNGGSKMIAYLTYISHLHLVAGWHVEKEALRMPSTKNWSIVSTKRAPESPAGRATAAALIAKALGQWKARDVEQEGKWFLTASKDLDKTLIES